ncbi:hypothetical protein CDAR_9551 [Caerostris darwini]|uniref:Uncharacterized protein n=1 Tax=Caerostris darwini TaxID=1538125 RepID=A0AAV4URI0_9ARAC|nr:hypothetical protein CDAR_9551 [Caerostris darwini]
MTWHYYRRIRLDLFGISNNGARVWQFIQGVIQVYPGCLKPGLELLQIHTAEYEYRTADAKFERFYSDVSEVSDFEEDDGWDDDINDTFERHRR